jgi:hypothetical protein
MLDACTTSAPTIIWSQTRFACHLRWAGVDGQRRGCGRLTVAILLPLPGCGVAPSVNVLGSFFPAWLICIVVGVVLAIVTWQAFVAMKIASHLGPTGLIYPCLAALWIFATWLLVFGG